MGQAIVTIKDLQPLQSMRTGSWSHPGLAPRVTSKLAHPSPAMPRVGHGASLCPPHATHLCLNSPTEEAELITRSTLGWFNNLSRSDQGSASPRLGSPLPGTACVTHSPAVTSWGANALGREGGSSIFSRPQETNRVLVQVAVSPTHPLSHCHGDAATLCSLEPFPDGGAGRGPGWWHPHLHDRANTPKYSQGGQRSKGATANAATAPAVEFSWVPPPELSQTHPAWAAPAHAPYSPSALAPKPSFCNQFPSRDRGSDNDLSAHSFTRGARPHHALAVPDWHQPLGACCSQPARPGK